MRRLMLIDSHYGRSADAIFRPQPIGSDDSWLGWDVIVGGDEDDSTFVYMVPDLDSNPPLIDVYVGKTGDPTRDVLVCVVQVNPQEER